MSPNWGSFRGGRDTPPPDPAFHRDGSLRDIYVFDVGLREWAAALDFVHQVAEDPKYRLDDAAVDRPADLRALFDPDPKRWLGFSVGSILLCCHFFDASEIEFDLVPSDVQTAADVEALREFLQGLADHLGRRVFLTEENDREHVHWRIEPNT